MTQKLHVIVCMITPETGLVAYPSIYINALDAGWLSTLYCLIATFTKGALVRELLSLCGTLNQPDNQPSVQ